MRQIDSHHGFTTRQLHAGRFGADAHSSRTMPIYMTAGFEFGTFEEGREKFAGAQGTFAYTRVANPTNDAVERRVADLEGGIGGLLLGSGQAAVATVALTLLSAGDHVVASCHLYEGSREFLRDDLRRLGIGVTFVEDCDDLESWEAAITPETRMVFAESISNPRNDVLDVAALAALAHAHHSPLVIDSTLATPYLLRPLEHGADVVLHSASKFLSGHGNVLGGIIVDAGRFDWDASAGRFPHLTDVRGADGLTILERSGPRTFLDTARHTSMRYGPSPSPMNASLLLQGIETLSLRVQRQSQTALLIARWLEEQPEVTSVDYSGLPSHRHHELALRYLPEGQGSVFAVSLRGGIDAARSVIESVGIFTHMTHLGDVRSLILHPATTTHAQRSPEEREACGIGPGMLRLSIGLEDPVDLLADLRQALDAIPAPAPAARTVLRRDVVLTEVPA